MKITTKRQSTNYLYFDADFDVTTIELKIYSNSSEISN